LSQFDDLAGQAVVQHLRGQQGDAAVVMVVVVPGEELLANGTRVLDGAEALGEGPRCKWKVARPGSGAERWLSQQGGGHADGFQSQAFAATGSTGHNGVGRRTLG
jgi:hypothetical protein